ncbi:polyketide synthase dehydratase domain-containing protein [Streptomyces zhihengii]
MYAEVGTGGEPGREDDGFGIDPALLDAAGRALAALTADAGPAPRRISAWDGLRLHATGAAFLRVRLTALGPDRCRLHAADSAGRTVLTARALTLTAAPEQPAARQGGSRLHRLDWPEAPAPATAPGRAPGRCSATGRRPAPGDRGHRRCGPRLRRPGRPPRRPRGG